MICPRCNKDIPDKDIAKHLASKGGKKSRRVITKEQQARMQAGRKIKAADIIEPEICRKKLHK